MTQIVFKLDLIKKHLQNPAIISWEYLYKAIGVYKLFSNPLDINIDFLYMNVANQKLVSEKIRNNCLYSTLTVLQNYSEIDRIKYYGWDSVKFSPIYCKECYNQGLYFDDTNNLREDYDKAANIFVKNILDSEN